MLQRILTALYAALLCWTGNTTAAADLYGDEDE
jgi:hypothetical protein